MHKITYFHWIFFTLTIPLLAVAANVNATEIDLGNGKKIDADLIENHLIPNFVPRVTHCICIVPSFNDDIFNYKDLYEAQTVRIALPKEEDYTKAKNSCDWMTASYLRINDAGGAPSYHQIFSCKPSLEFHL
jgi:hypothetical protein